MSTEVVFAILPTNIRPTSRDNTSSHVTQCIYTNFVFLNYIQSDVIVLYVCNKSYQARHIVPRNCTSRVVDVRPLCVCAGSIGDGEL
jgi:hypothetical protein